MTTRNMAGGLAQMLTQGQVYTPAPALWQASFLGGALPGGISFSRASSASYINASGVLASAGSNTARLGTSPTTLAARGLLIEGAGTNVQTYSYALNNWNTNAGATLNNATVAPDGSNAYSVAFGANWASGLYRSALGLTNAAACTISGYFKYVGGDATVYFGGGNTVWGTGAQTASITFNSQTGAFMGADAGVSSYSIMAAGNGWYRVAVTATLATGTTADVIIFHGSGTAGESAAWGIMAETGSFAGSFISTNSNTVTVSRAADVATIATTLPALLFNASEGTLFVEAEFLGLGSTSQPLLQLDDGTSANKLVLTQSSGNLSALVTTAGVSKLNSTIATSLATGTVYKAALAYKANDFAACAGGGTVAAAASGAVPGSLTTLRLGSNSSGSQFANAWLRRVAYYPRRLTNAELQTLTV
ncbi:MAG TPA: hypothetical protein VHP58_02495 [Alphaproteobacteria bacterium]|nr:hypothetical protein [Alphaproteobacteria bacterium]